MIINNNLTDFLTNIGDKLDENQPVLTSKTSSLTYNFYQGDVLDIYTTLTEEDFPYPEKVNVEVNGVIVGHLNENYHLEYTIPNNHTGATTIELDNPEFYDQTGNIRVSFVKRNPQGFKDAIESIGNQIGMSLSTKTAFLNYTGYYTTPDDVNMAKVIYLSYVNNKYTLNIVPLFIRAGEGVFLNISSAVLYSPIYIYSNDAISISWTDESIKELPLYIATNYGVETDGYYNTFAFYLTEEGLHTLRFVDEE